MTRARWQEWRTSRFVRGGETLAVIHVIAAGVVLEPWLLAVAIVWLVGGNVAHERNRLIVRDQQKGAR